MASAQKKLATVDIATLALWRVAETGDVEELKTLLPRVTDINARNEHGVTALMRAAQHGRVKMVRVLLEHGADANLKRNDKFTALSLAAFFGHTEVVRTLMEHGADSNASTRGGTSPQMWATARTFNEVADQLEKPATPRPLAVVKPARVVEKTTTSPVVAAMVKKLKDPPEIWDLVHEEPRGFDARTAFVTRLKSIKTGFAFRAAAAVVLIGVCVVGVLVLRGVQARNERNLEPQPSSAAQTDPGSQPVIPITPIAPTVSAPAEATVAPEATLPISDKPVTVTKLASRSRAAVSPYRVERDDSQPATSEIVEPVAAPSEKSETQTPVITTAKPKTSDPKPSDPLSPQLITPAKTAAPKGKVIQWP